MSTSNPASQEYLDVILALANALAGNHSRGNYPWPNPINERIEKLEKENAELRKRLVVTDEMVERGARAMMEISPDFAYITDGERDWYIREARVVLDAALGTAFVTEEKL